jgi:glutamyl-tRNA synthetase
MATGRFAPSPTGDLHLGNLRTALVAWLFARASGSRFLLRMEDLDRVTSSPAIAQRQQEDLAAIGLDWDGDVAVQSSRFARHTAALDALTAHGLTYTCYCTRKEIREAASAPHGAVAAYPGTCRNLSDGERVAHEARGRRPAVRLRAGGACATVTDRRHGEISGTVDDVVLRRNDGVPAYHLAVVLDDADHGVEEVVRGDDLLDATPTQVHLAGLLGLPAPTYAHVPLVLGPDGERLAKRHGAVTLRALAAAGVSPATVRARLAESLGLAEADEPVTPAALIDRFDPDRLPTDPWTLCG